MQSRQVLSELGNCPALQGLTQSVLPFELLLPTGQGVHVEGLVAPIVFELVSSLQSVQCDCARASAYFPA